jgi:hypothetical protein
VGRRCASSSAEHLARWEELRAHLKLDDELVARSSASCAVRLMENAD